MVAVHSQSTALNSKVKPVLRILYLSLDSFQDALITPFGIGNNNISHPDDRFYIKQKWVYSSDNFAVMKGVARQWVP
jgi:hypothetical protein